MCPHALSRVSALTTHLHVPQGAAAALWKGRNLPGSEGRKEGRRKKGGFVAPSPAVKRLLCQRLSLN